jgi:tRNA threonylcarbamoyladenosine biosynthesis protein TsaE
MRSLKNLLDSVMMILGDADATAEIGALLAQVLIPGDVIALYGDLGAGKTTMARGLLKAMGLAGEAPSPTFAIVQPYDPPDVRIPLWHIDLYRLEGADEAVELGLDEAREYAGLLVEWPERLGDLLWPDALLLRLEIVANGDRRLTASVPPAWEGRWPPPLLQQ